VIGTELYPGKLSTYASLEHLLPKIHQIYENFSSHHFRAEDETLHKKSTIFYIKYRTRLEKKEVFFSPAPKSDHFLSLH